MSWRLVIKYWLLQAQGEVKCELHLNLFFKPTVCPANVFEFHTELRLTKWPNLEFPLNIPDFVSPSVSWR